MTMFRAHLRLAAALLLPVAILAASWATIHRQSQQGQEWLVPIRGYDPRDLLRGHYVQYRYDWPTSLAQDDRNYRDPAYAAALCVNGTAPHIRAVHPLIQASGHSAQATSPGCAIVIRGARGTRREVRGLERGIFYVPQGQAFTLTKQLADPQLQGMLRVRVRSDGVMQPVALEFRPRPAAAPSL
ncbi:GDYXXLXY domain-containing protein [Sphingobium sp.]|uniref:GDYXXLXY domain-containing protein n=1 Tax=Sphingobium sp. TaxID=1912891 RepID=UPI003B3BB872